MVSLIFVHSALDDADLTPSQFRVYAHLARRADGEGRARPGIESIADVCKLHPDTTRAAIKVLTARQMLEIEERPGRARIYILTPPEKWVNPPEDKGGLPPLKEAPPSIPTPLVLRESTPPKAMEDTPPNSMDPKVIQVKEIPVKTNGEVASGEFLTKDQIWNRCCPLVHHPAQKAKSYEIQHALYEAPDMTDAEMRSIERLYAVAAERPEKQIRVKQKVLSLLLDLPAELAKASQQGLNGKHGYHAKKPAGMPEDWPAFVAHFSKEFPGHEEKMLAWKTWDDGRVQFKSSFESMKDNYHAWRKEK